ncbi:MAG: protein kinase domain-containing protein [Planctomycetia bacterium]
MSLRLKIEQGQDSGKSFGLKDGGVYVLGRDPASAVRVLDMKVSKAHCEIEVTKDDGVWLRDIGSTQGTHLNGTPVKGDTSIKAGDEIKIGFTVLRVLGDGAADVAATANRAAGAPASAQASAPTAAAPAAAQGPASTSTSASSPAAAASAGKPSGPPATAPQANTTAKPAAPAQPKRELPPDALVGKDLGGYRVLKKIGQGGMGSVYIAEQVSLKREVALKVLSERFVADAAFVDQFVNEARAAGQLNHPNVVQVYDVGQVDGRYFFSMEFVGGGSIEDQVKAKPAEWRTALNWFLDASNALIFASKRGILHRDVKPDNLMLAEDGSAKLCDLGLAKKSESDDLLAEGIIGTPHFISPEAIRRKPDIDGRTDLYSLGCTFFRILTGTNPYPLPTVKDILMAHLNKPVPRVTDKKPDVPRELSDVVFKLMQKEPSERYESAGDLYKALDKIRIQHGLAEHGIKPASRKPLIIALLVVVLAAAAVVGYLVTRPEKVKGESEEDRQRREAAIASAKAEQDKRQEAERRTFVSDRNAERLALAAEKAGGRIEDTWRDGKWQALLGRFDDLRQKIASDDRFGQHPDALEAAKQVEQDAKAIRDELATLAQVDAKLQAAKAGFQKDLFQAWQDHLDKVRGLQEPGESGVARWWDAARLLAKEPMKAFAEQGKGKEVELGGRKWPLMPEDVRSKALAERFPGEDWPGQRAYEEILKQRAPQVHAESIKRGVELAAPATIAALEAGATELERYRDLLPEPDAADRSEVAELLRKHRGEAGSRARDMRKAVGAEGDRLVAADRADAFKLIHMLREPGQGALWTLNFGALDGDPRLLAQGMRTPGYKALAAMLLDDARAVQGLFRELAEGFAAKRWKDVDIEGPEGKKAKVTEVTADGMALGPKVKLSFASLGHERLLAQVFLPGGQPRLDFAPESLRGLAVLAELAGDGALAQRQWQAFRSTPAASDAAVQQGVMRRMASLPLEMEAARCWLDMRRAHDLIERTREELVGMGLAVPAPPLTPAQRDKILRARQELERARAEAGQALATLRSREDLQNTLWGASALPAPHARAAYAGEAPGAPPEPAAPAGGKPGN